MRVFFFVVVGVVILDVAFVVLACSLATMASFKFAIFCTEIGNFYVAELCGDVERNPSD